MVKQGDQILQLTNTNLLMDMMFRESELFQQSNNLRNTRLSMEQFKLQLNQQLSDIENRLQQQRRVYERYKELDKDNLISRHQYELAKDQYEYLVKQKELTVESQKSELKFRQAQLEALEESLSRMQANLDIVKQRQENLTLVAPVSGQLTSLTSEVGESISQGTRLGQIDQWDGRFKIKASIEERFIAQIKPKDASAPGEWPVFLKYILVREKQKVWPGGVWGDPSRAGAQQGEEILAGEVERLSGVIAALEKD